MSNSNRLRETHIGKTIISTKSKKQENAVSAATIRVFAEIKNKYPNVKFELKTRLYKNEISEKIKALGADKDELMGSVIFNKKSHIRPDGKFLFAKINNKLKLILSSEAKHQGTNDKRKNEGKGNQAKGNACERAYKNQCELAAYTMDEDIFPYSIFLSGCDFAEGSSIRDRVTTMSFMSPVNKIYVRDINKIKRASLFVRENKWTCDEIYEINLKIAIEALKYYRDKI